MSSETPSPLPPQLDVLLHDGPCIFVNKPGGILTQAPPGIDSLEIRVKKYIRQSESIAGKVYTGVPHRLDRPVAGVIVFGRHVRATSRIAAQFEQRTVKKLYWAMVEGNVQPDSGTWTDWMRKVHDRAVSEIVDELETGAQKAVLHFRVLARSNRSSWLEIQLETGRTHQIRLQTASRGHSILGDELYGNQTLFGPQTVDLRARWIALLARQLEIRHPIEDRQVQVIAPVPECWNALDDFEFPVS